MDVLFDAGFAERDLGVSIRPASAEFDALWRSLPLEKREDAPRFEAWFDDEGRAYGYGRGAGYRVYESRPKTEFVASLKAAVERRFGCKFEGCFVNGYRDGRDHLGWHADDSPEMDDDRPIAIVSFGGARMLEFRPKSKDADGKAVKIDAMTQTTSSGSLIAMPPGFQDRFEHRIAKSGFVVPPRLSFTFRGVLPVPVAEPASPDAVDAASADRGARPGM
ncbi:MAG: alpha-ketoglutarate-dependent dioxygenase AlkB [Azospirillum sp.]|nr:alpha-ketoglutarate-dependent dioxygenase AlkB [Azospirillum sp.]